MAKNVTYKTVDLFGNEQIRFVEQKRRTNKTLFDDFDSFVDKFEEKKTTDDCYTPPEVYQAVIDFISKRFDLNGLEIVRPFYPGGDFESIDYKPNSIVIDNPPFSIISKIARYYIADGVKFFLFAPHMTLFSAGLECTQIVTGGDIVYENGAVVKTSFLSNLFGDIRIMGAPELFQTLQAINDKNKANLPKYEYPPNILTVSMVQKFVENGIDFEVNKSHCQHCRQLDSQKPHKKTLFGSGYMISDQAAAEKAAAEKAAAEKAAAEKAVKQDSIIWELSEKERKVIESLGK